MKTTGAPNPTARTPMGLTRQESIDDAIDACEGALASLRQRRVVQAISGLRRAIGQAEAAERLEPTTYGNQI